MLSRENRARAGYQDISLTSLRDDPQKRSYLLKNRCGQEELVQRNGMLAELKSHLVDRITEFQAEGSPAPWASSGGIGMTLQCSVIVSVPSPLLPPPPNSFFAKSESILLDSPGDDLCQIGSRVR